MIEFWHPYQGSNIRENHEDQKQKKFQALAQTFFWKERLPNPVPEVASDRIKAS